MVEKGVGVMRALFPAAPAALVIGAMPAVAHASWWIDEGFACVSSRNRKSDTPHRYLSNYRQDMPGERAWLQRDGNHWILEDVNRLAHFYSFSAACEKAPKPPQQSNQSVTLVRLHADHFQEVLSGEITVIRDGNSETFRAGGHCKKPGDCQHATKVGPEGVAYVLGRMDRPPTAS